MDKTISINSLIAFNKEIIKESNFSMRKPSLSSQISRASLKASTGIQKKVINPALIQTTKMDK